MSMSSEECRLRQLEGTKSFQANASHTDREALREAL